MSASRYLYDVIREITAACNDPEADRLADRAQDHLLSAIDELINNGVSTEDIPGFVHVVTGLDFSKNPFNTTSYPIRELKGLFLPPETAKEVTVTIKPIEELARIANNVELRPTEQDLFLYKAESEITALIHSDSIYALATDNFNMHYIQDVEAGNWHSADASGTCFRKVDTASIASGTLTRGRAYRFLTVTASAQFASSIGVASGGAKKGITYISASSVQGHFRGSVLQQITMFSDAFIDKAIRMASATLLAEDRL